MKTIYMLESAQNNTSIKDFIDTRIFGLLKSGEVTVVINGYGEIPNVRIYI